MSLRKKNKRGDRGSIDEDNRRSKKSNMASNSKEVLEDDCNTLDEDQAEPSLLEIKEMLIDIQISIASVIADNQAIRKEIDDLKSSVTFNGEELKDLKASLKKTKDENKALKISLAALNTRLTATEKELQNQSAECEQLWENLDHLEQYSRKNSLEIHGVPQDAYTSTEHVVIKAAEALHITVEPEEIEISHKINQGRSILVKFCSHKTKAKIYKERTKLRHVKIADLFPGYPSTAQHRIFGNENLTAFRRSLIEAANKRRKDGSLYSVWSLDGKIYVKCTPEGSPVRILTEEDLKDI